jgi:hypothetical protein
MTSVLIAATGLVLLVAIAFLVLFRRLGSQAGSAEPDLAWSNEFSIAKYRPMERLFLEEDYDFLAAQPGFHPGIHRKLQAERRRVFRHYLRCMRLDFGRLLTTAKLLLLHAPQDQPDLARNLVRQRLMFSYAMGVVEFRLVLQTLGIGTVDVRGLVDAVESMREELRRLSQHVQVVPTTS